MIKKIILPALGYLLVAFVCGLAGYALIPERVGLTSGEFVLLVLLMALFLPVYINRAALYEQKIRGATASDSQYDDTLLRGMSFSLPIITFSFAVVFLALLLFGTKLELPPESSNATHIIIRLCLAILPSYVFGLWNAYGWQKDNRVYSFMYRSFYPALATCVSPFIYGWSSSDGISDLAISSSILIFLWVLSFILNFLKLTLFLFASLILAVSLTIFSKVFEIPQLVLHYDLIQVFTFGILMTLSMGVSESWRVTTRVRDGVEYGPPGVYDQDDTELYLSGTNLAAALFLPFLLITFFHPSTNSLYIWGVLIFIILQYVIWFSMVDKWPHQAWSIAGIFFGLVLPTLIALGTEVKNNAPFSTQLFDIPSFFNVSGPLAILIGYLTLIAKKTSLIKNIVPKLKISSFTHLRPCVALTGLVAAVILLVISFAPPFLEKKQETEIVIFFLGRTRFLQLIYFLAVVACSFSLLYIKDPNEGVGNTGESATDSVSETGKVNDEEKNQGSSSQFSYLLETGRLTTSIISGAVALLIISLNSENSIFWGIARVMPIIFVTMIGFILNDIFDTEKDRSANVSRPLADGNLDEKYAKKGIFILILVSVLLELLFFDFKPLMVLLSALIGVLLYTPFSLRFPPAKGIWTALLTFTPVLYAEYISRANIPLSVYLLIFLYIVGRELLLDVKDYNGDVGFGLKTIPFYLGLTSSRWVSWILMFTSVSSVLLLSNGHMALLFAVCSFATLSIAAYFYLKNQELSILTTRFVLLLSSISLFTGV